MTSSRSIGADEARTHFYRLLVDVAGGESITITKRGRPVANLVPVDRATANADEMLERFRALRTGNRLGGLSIRELIDEGRKY
jgi:prevent-host-death family protein